MIDAQTITKELTNGKSVLIDVRSKLEYKMGHADGAVHVSHANIASADIPSKDTTVYLYCASGNRSGMAQSVLQAQGYTNVVNIGGISNWRGIGGKIV